jgi:hypothetical protein
VEVKMSSEGEMPFDPAKTKEALDQLMKTEQGREIAEKVKAKLRELDLQFQTLNEGDKKEFVKNFQRKFTDSFDDLRESIRKNILDPEEDLISGESALPASESTEFNPLHSVSQPDYKLFIFAFILVVLVFG